MESDRPLPPRTSRFAPGIYFNFEVGLSLTSSDRPPVRAGVQYASQHMQDRIYRQTHPNRHHQPSHEQQQQYSRTPPLNGYHQTTQDYEQDRRRLSVRPLPQHERSSSAPPAVERDDHPNPLTTGEPPIRAFQQTNSFPRETLDRPLPYSPARFRLGEDNLPWSVPPWYRPPEPECTSPIVPRAPRAPRAPHRSPPWTGASGGLPSIGFESGGRRERERERPRSSNSSSHSHSHPNASRGRDRESRRTEDPQRVKDLGELHQAMMTVDSLHREPWARDDNDNDNGGALGLGYDNSAVGYGPGSLGWAVRTEPVLGSGSARARADAIPIIPGEAHRHGGLGAGVGNPGTVTAGGGDGGRVMSPPPAYLDSQWEAWSRWAANRPRSTG